MLRLMAGFNPPTIIFSFPASLLRGFLLGASMMPVDVREQIISPALKILGPKFTSPDAIRMLLAIGLQESLFKYREQTGGPARGFWQFESGGGVKGVLTHPSSRDLAIALCKARGIEPTQDAVYRALPHDDILAAGFARLLLWTDPKPLPMTSEDGWNYYQRVWRPGKPHPEKWTANWIAACRAMGA